MRVLYAGDSTCDLPTLKRLALVANEVAFLDRPSVTFRDWGTIGSDSPVRHVDTTSRYPVDLSVYGPPSGPVSDLYGQYIEADLANSRFVSVVLQGLAESPRFQRKLVQLDGNYGSTTTGSQIISALVHDSSLISAKLASPVDGRLLFNVESTEARIETLKVLLIEASINVTSALLIAEESNLVPVSDDPFFCRLLALRMADAKYVSNPSAVAARLGLSIAQSVLPDELLPELTLDDIGEYKQSAQVAYSAWTTEIDRLAVRIASLDPERASEEIPQLIASEITPKIVEYRHEMQTARDKLFGDLIKKIAKWEFPTLSIAYLASLDVATAVGMFAGALVPVVPPVVDYFVERRKVHRGHAMAYLVDVAKGVD